MKKQRKIKIRSKNTYAVMIAAFALILIAAIVAMLFYNGVFLINNPSEEEYPVRGVDVSAYQGEIDWQTLGAQGIDFAYIKATEGSSHTDERFEFNHNEALKTELRIGAYHFFSFESGGDTQAAHFIATVPKTENMLPPAIDLELYGDFEKNRPDADKVTAELDKFIAAVEAHYDIKPIIYATEESYSHLLISRYDELDIWIRGVYSKPKISDGRAWTFWQYTNRETLNGYNGEEKFIDMNVFNGSAEEFALYPQK
ncbi:MAG: hypothetical protein IJB49_01870 [Clostridia bacterium]|nr:hypothetical protein [Clostridia bacterium]